MIKSTRLRLTIWFVVLVGLVALFFSGFIYMGMSRTFRQSFGRAETHLERMKYFEQNPNSLPPAPPRLRGRWNENHKPMILFQEDYEEVREEMLLTLILVNGSIWILAGGVGYILAGKLLKPLEDAIEEQKRFVSDASHELRTPVTALKTALEVNIEDKKVHAFERRLMRENLEDISSLQMLINRLLRLSQTESANGLEKQEIEVAKHLKKVIKTLMPLAKEKHVKVEVELKPQTQKLNFDPNLFDELMTILIDNAIKYSSKGGLVVVNSVMNEKQMVLKVKDDGLGMSVKDLKHIFDRFYRAENARTKTHNDGFGLGLAIAKKIVTQHEGRIEVKSVKDKGSTFCVTVPK